MVIELKPTYDKQPKSMVPKKCTILEIIPVQSPDGQRGIMVIGEIPKQ